MDVAAIASEERLPAHKSSRQRQSGFGHWKSERDQRDRDRHNGRAFLRTGQRKHRRHKAQKQAARIAEEDRGRIEVIAEKSHYRADQYDRDQTDLGVPLRVRKDQNRDQRKDRSSSRQPVYAVNQIERVRDADDPQDRNGETRRHRQTQMAAERRRKVLDAETRRINHRRGGYLKGQFPGRRRAAKIVVDTQEENECRRREQG